MSIKCDRIEPDNEIDKLLVDKYTHTLRPGYVEVGEDKICLPLAYETVAERIDNLEIRDTDVMVATFPKSGTTWMQEIVWMMLNDMDTEKSKEFAMTRLPFLERQCTDDCREVLAKDPNAVIPSFSRDSISFTMSKSNPRIIKSHLPWSLLPRQIRERTKTAKTIYVIRNPKDLCVSFYHYGSYLDGFQGDFHDFCKLFLADRVLYCPYWKHVLSYWQNRDDPNMLIIRFENMKKDLAAVIRRVAVFLEVKFDEDKIQALLEHLSFDSMKQNQNTQFDGYRKMKAQFIQLKPGAFFRSGSVGNYKAHMTPEMIETFDKWTEENTRDTGLTFDL